MSKNNSKAENFADAVKNNPKEIIEWAEAEIKEYQKLIKSIKDRLKVDKSK